MIALIGPGGKPRGSWAGARLRVCQPALGKLDWLVRQYAGEAALRQTVVLLLVGH